MPGKITIPQGPVSVDPKKLKSLFGSEEQQIINMAQAYAEADIHVSPGENQYSITAKVAGFAKVGVGVAEGSGYYIILKKVNGLWVAIATGQDLPSKATGEKYGLPAGWYSTEY